MKFQPVTPEICSKVLEIFLSNRIEKDALNPERKRIFHEDWVKHMELPIREILDLVAPESTVDEFIHYLNNTFGGRVFRNLRLNVYKEDSLHDVSEITPTFQNSSGWCYKHFSWDAVDQLEGEFLIKMIIEAYRKLSDELDFRGYPSALPFISNILLPNCSQPGSVISAYAFLEARIAQASARI